MRKSKRTYAQSSKESNSFTADDCKREDKAVLGWEGGEDEGDEEYEQGQQKEDKAQAGGEHDDEEHEEPQQQAAEQAVVIEERGGWEGDTVCLSELSLVAWWSWSSSQSESRGMRGFHLRW